MVTVVDIFDIARDVNPSIRSLRHLRGLCVVSRFNTDCVALLLLVMRSALCDGPLDAPAETKLLTVSLPSKCLLLSSSDREIQYPAKLQI